MYFLPASSSEVVHKKAVNELRDMDFGAFENIVVQQLSKEVQLKPSAFRKKQVNINYRDENNDVCHYKYNLPDMDDEDEDESQRRPCFGSYRPPPMETRRVTIVSQMLMVKLNFWHHLREMRTFLKHDANLRAEGIFLKAGSQERQKVLRDEMKKSFKIDFWKMDCTVYDCANVLKHFLHQMPEPLFASNYYPAYERIAKIEQAFERDNSKRRSLMAHVPIGRMLPPDSELMLKERKLLNCLQLMVHLLPQQKREIFEEVLDILEAVYNHRAYNRMSATSLGSIFAPLIITPRNLPREVAYSVSREMAGIISRMIKMGKDVLGEPKKLGLEVWDYIRNPPPMAKYDDSRVSDLLNADF